MSRSGYNDDYGSEDPWGLIRWRGQVASVIRGKRGQAFLLEMLHALDSLPEKKLIEGNLEQHGQVCAIGAVGLKRGIDMSALDPSDYEGVASAFGIAHQLAQEVVYVNDEQFLYSTDDAGYLRSHNGKLIEMAPEERFEKVRAWIVSLILPVPIED